MPTISTASSQDSPLDVAGLKAIVFDFDGTLVDSEPVWKATFFELFKERYQIEVPMEILWANTGGGVDLSVRNISNRLSMGMTEIEIATMAHDLHAEMQRKILEELPLRVGVTQVFDWAISKSVSMAICTASTKELIESYFKKQNSLEIFAHIESTAISDLEHRKPFPYPYLQTLKALDVSAEHALVFEDSPSGITSAVAAGIPTIAIHNPFLELKDLEAQPKFVVEDFLQVLELLAF